MSPEHKAKIGATNHKRFVDRRDNDLLATMVALYHGGKTCQQISDATAKPLMTVWRWLKNSGIAMQKRTPKTWSPARRKHQPEKPPRDPLAPTGYDILTARAIGNKYVTKMGYVVVHIGRKQSQYEHILIVEKVLRRKLPKGIVVHHVNCNPSQNANTNLLVCSHQYHLELHARMRKHPYWSQFSNPFKPPK